MTDQRGCLCQLQFLIYAFERHYAPYQTDDNNPCIRHRAALGIHC